MPRSQINERQREYLNVVFKYHTPKGDQPERYEEIRNAGKDLAMIIMTCAPHSSEQERALAKLEEVIMLANAAIARSE